MARRGGRRGQWLASDDYTGKTVYASKLQRDYWGNYAVRPLKRNLQEIASPLNDPQPVPFYRGPTYEYVPPYSFDAIRVTVGNTNTPTEKSVAADVMGWDVGIGSAAVGISFVVR